MLSFVQNWFGQKANPIGVDFGSDSLRLAQVQFTDGEYRLTAAATADVPSAIRNDPAKRLNFFVETTRDLLAQGKFKGRQAVFALPAAAMFIQHLRMAKMDEDETKKALPWEAQGKLPIDPTTAVLRHLIAGEVYQDQEPKNEIIVMAARREVVNQILAMANKTKLDILGMNVEPKALLDCFGRIYRRKNDKDMTNCFVDIGAVSSRAVVTRGAQILFARSIPVGGDHFTRAVATAMKLGFDDARQLRIKLATSNPSLDESREKQSIQAPAPAAAPADSSDNSFALLGAGLAAAQGGTSAAAASRAVAERRQGLEPVPSSAASDQANAVEIACREPLAKLIEELNLCRRYYESTFPDRPMDRLIFVGGEARQRGLCQSIAREMGLAAQVGDPMVRMGRVSEVGVETGIDRRQPQPNWGVAIGLSMGPLDQDESAEKGAKPQAATA